MSTTKWHQGPALAFDTETTGTDVHGDHIVTAAIVTYRPDARPTTNRWLIDPGLPIPDEAAAVHGWTTDRVKASLQGHQALRVGANGVTRALTREGALNEIAAQLGHAIGHDIPVVIANAPYDTTLLDNDLRTVGIDPIADRPRGWAGVIDPMVLEKQFDPYRKVKGGCRGGKHQCGGCGTEDKKLTSLCQHYGVPLTSAHDAGADALAAVRLAIRLMQVWPDAARLKLGTLHEHQVGWRREQANGLRSYFDRAGIEHDGVCGEWPVHQVCAPALVGGVS